MAKAQSLQRSASAASRPLALPSVLEDASLQVIEKTLGGRAGLIAALSHAPKSRDLEYLLGLIGDPENDQTPLGHLCAQGGITPGELLQAWKSGALLKSHLLVTQQVVDALPSVVADVLKHAAPYEDTCHACQGLRRVTPEPTKKVPNPEPIDCPVCQGGGKLTYEADLERTKIALELAQLTSKGGGISVQVDARSAHLHGGGGGGMSAGGTLENLMAASDQILYGGGNALPLARAEAQDMQDAPAGQVLSGEVVDAEIDADPLEGADSPDDTQGG